MSSRALASVLDVEMVRPCFSLGSGAPKAERPVWDDWLEPRGLKRFGMVIPGPLDSATDA